MDAQEDRATARHTVEVRREAATLVRGALTAAALGHAAERLGGNAVRCTLEDDGLVIFVDCGYSLPVRKAGARSNVVLPVPLLPLVLADIPMQTARELRVQSAGEVSVSGILVALPAAQTWRSAGGSYHVQRIGLVSLSRLTLAGETWIAPGEQPLATPEAALLVFAPRYLPRPSAWLALWAGIITALAALRIVYPVRARLPGNPELWQPDLNSVAFLLRPIALLMVWLVNWLRLNWPILLNTLLAGALVAVGAAGIGFAWALAAVHDVAERLALLPEWLPVLPSLQWAAWSGWPLVLALLSACLLLAGLGLLARKEPAWLLVVGCAGTGLAATILVWPHLLLAPLMFPLQLEALLIYGAIALLITAALIHSLTHPHFRRYYQGIR